MLNVSAVAINGSNSTPISEVKTFQSRYFRQNDLHLCKCTPQDICSGRRARMVTITAFEDGDVFHYRDKSGLEADIIIRLRSGKWAAVEVKLGNREIEEAAKALRES
jgi:hypothetical protein